MKRVRSNHNSLLNYFLYDKQDLSPAYTRKCEEFIDSLGSSKLANCFKMEAPSHKRQAPSLTSLKQPDTSRIIKENKNAKKEKS